MFDFAWTEIALIGVVALVAIGPKDLPVAIKAVAEMVKKARRMAGEFQTHVDEMVREANLHEVRDQFNDLRRMDIKGKILEAVDGDKTIRNTIKDNPFEFKPAPPPVPVADTAPAAPGLDDAVVTELAVAEHPAHVIPAPTPEQEPAESAEAAAPSFLPPTVVAAGRPSSRSLPPAFVPPAVVAASTRRRDYASPYA
jgi:sec-independent protein translocase protein TatB